MLMCLPNRFGSSGLGYLAKSRIATTIVHSPPEPDSKSDVEELNPFR
jgi:hypothetical protein